ncbi:protein of unknown function [uncultured Woeseiaceae bacterium]|uniref:Uncharacterized protein n=1 Tax=uncultured Woeseiaceae bacterium TaxID=1983305 RepID=A0A7D9D2H0_9GAMM|nr:protein of unknown function [uncultured Woeseiaceae bacterium]
MAEQENSLPNDNNVGEGHLLRAFLAHWIHEDNLYWAQVRHLMIFELAALAALFALGISVLTAMVMFTSAAITWRFYFLAKVICRNRDTNRKTIALVSRHVAMVETQNLVKDRIGPDEFEKWGVISFAQTTRKGRKFQKHIFGFCVVLNILLGISVLLERFFGVAVLSLLHPHFSLALQSASAL